MRVIGDAAIVRALVGVSALSAFERLEARLLGRLPVYAAAEIVRRLRGRRRRGRIDAIAGAVLRTAYALALARLRAKPSALVVATTAVELALSPAMGMTPPLRRWRAAELCLLPLHVTSFFGAIALWDRAHRR